MQLLLNRSKLHSKRHRELSLSLRRQNKRDKRRWSEPKEKLKQLT